MRYAANVFVPVGMFGPKERIHMGARATALFAGRVVAVRTLHNGWSGASFVHLVVATYMGELDVVAPVEVAPVAKEGTIALVEGWLVGRPAVPPPAPAPWWRRLFG